MTLANIFNNLFLPLDGYDIMEGKRFRELVGGVAYENPYAQDIADRG